MHHTKINWECSNANIDYLPLINTILIDTLINQALRAIVVSEISIHLINVVPRDWLEHCKLIGCWMTRHIFDHYAIISLREGTCECCERTSSRDLT